VAKRILPFDQALRAHDWRPRYRPAAAVQLSGRTALVLGYGAIGQRVARGCAGLGMRVLAVRRDPPAPPRPGDDPAVHAPSDLPDLLGRADALLVTLPLTPATLGLIDATALARLPEGALLVNVSRGPIIDERALFDALTSGHLGGAGLDVWYQYPADDAARASTAPGHFPFEDLPNVVLSPHRGGSTTDTEAGRVAALAELLNAAARGEPIANEVRPALGY
jgi:phosphoglycerate dehydrogenase-like enzyme